MKKNSNQVVQFLWQQSQTKPMTSNKTKRILLCLAVWVNFGSIKGDILVQSQLVQASIQILQTTNNQDEFQAALSVFIDVVYSYNTIEEDDLEIVLVIQRGLKGLKQRYEKSLVDHEDELSLGLTRAFSNMGLAYSIQIILAPIDMNQVDMLELIVLCYAHPSFEVASRTFYFFMDFIDDLTKLEPLNLKEAKYKQFSHIVKNLVEISLLRIQFPANYKGKSKDNTKITLPPAENKLMQAQIDKENNEIKLFHEKFEHRFNIFDEDSIEMKDDFYEHRYDVALLLKSLCYASDISKSTSVITGSTESSLGIDIEAKLLKNLLSMMEIYKGFTPTERLISWQQTEAAVYAFNAISDEVSFRDPNSLSFMATRKIIQTLLEIEPYNSIHHKVYRSCVELLGDIATFFVANGDLLPQIIRFIVTGLEMYKGIRPHAAYAIKQIFISNRLQLSGKSDRINNASVTIELINLFPTFRYKTKVMSHLVNALCIVVSQFDENSKLEAIQKISTYSIQILEQLRTINPQQQQILPDFIDKIDCALEILISMTRDLRVSKESQTTHHVMNQLVANYFTEITSIAKILPNNEDMIESVCKLLKYCSIASHSSFKQLLLLPSLQFIVNAYQFHPISSYMYLGSVITSEYYRDPNVAGLLVPMLTGFVTKSFSFLKSFENVNDNPEIVEDLYILATAFVEKLPEKIMNSEIYESLFELACVYGLEVSHDLASSAICGFLDTSLRAVTSFRPHVRIGMQSTEVKNEMYAIEQKNMENQQVLKYSLENVMNKFGKVLMLKLLRGICGFLPESRSKDFVYTLEWIGVFINNDESFLLMIKQSINELPEGKLVSEESKIRVFNQLALALQENDKDSFQDIIIQFGILISKKNERAI